MAGAETSSNTSFGYLLPTRELVMSQSEPDAGQIIDLAERAEDLDFGSVWAGDSILARPRLEALTTLAAIASRTRRVKLGTAVLLPALRNPVELANQAANLDILSQGRLILGVGIASKTPSVQREFASCGVSFAHRVSIFEEGLTIMRRLWTEPEVTFGGEAVSIGWRESWLASRPKVRHPLMDGGHGGRGQAANSKGRRRLVPQPVFGGVIH